MNVQLSVVQFLVLAKNILDMLKDKSITQDYIISLMPVLNGVDIDIFPVGDLPFHIK